jgi:hypothetical protein
MSDDTDDWVRHDRGEDTGFKALLLSHQSRKHGSVANV